MHFEVLQNAHSQWHWRLKASNGRVIADGAETYVRREDCIHGLLLVAEVNDDTRVQAGTITSLLGGETVGSLRRNERPHALNL
ncbi:YegP family protein [Terrihabitans rhizophilus]|uniref:DUF1508 domain-containing protein n=1 Tax=Terrihabitans rhizophilus TaxID=3092662 RepID=A0ABU4RNA7_9HYPH|nr:DUF1508 domain-containing protein [Terrihabitans sp. PJ23]MDX6806331.1 DUF1508 domain-containing protein [Terrihabitans sp. PJ23]